MPLALAASLGSAVRLSSPVERVRWSDTGVRVRAAGAELEADACVVAVPARVTASIRFEPGLPPALDTALAAIPYGDAAKLFVPLRGPAEPSAVMAVPERYWTWTATGDGDAVQPVLSAFAGSPGALERLAVAAGAERWLESVVRLRGDLPLDPLGRAALDLGRRSVGRRRLLDLAAAATPREVLARGAGALVFCGEHAGGKFAALMEGAVRSGRRAAAALLDRSAAARL